MRSDKIFRKKARESKNTGRISKDRLQIAFRKNNTAGYTGIFASLQIIREQSDKLSLKKRRLKAVYDLEYLKDLIT
jgi:hypothetical protein